MLKTLKIFEDKQTKDKQTKALTAPIILLDVNIYRPFWLTYQTVFFFSTKHAIDVCLEQIGLARPKRSLKPKQPRLYAICLFV